MPTSDNDLSYQKWTLCVSPRGSIPWGGGCQAAPTCQSYEMNIGTKPKGKYPLMWGMPSCSYLLMLCNEYRDLVWAQGEVSPEVGNAQLLPLVKASGHVAVEEEHEQDDEHQELHPHGDTLKNTNVWNWVHLVLKLILVTLRKYELTIGDMRQVSKFTFIPHLNFNSWYCNVCTVSGFMS